MNKGRLAELTVCESGQAYLLKEISTDMSNSNHGNEKVSY